MLRAVGQLDQFAKDTFARETASVTHGAAAWQLAPELNMSEVRLDGLLLVHAPALLAPLAPPQPRSPIAKRFLLARHACGSFASADPSLDCGCDCGGGRRPFWTSAGPTAK